MNKLFPEDFHTRLLDCGYIWIKFDELQTMIKDEIITIDFEKLKKYHERKIKLNK